MPTTISWISEKRIPTTSGRIPHWFKKIRNKHSTVLGNVCATTLLKNIATAQLSSGQAFKVFNESILLKREIQKAKIASWSFFSPSRKRKTCASLIILSGIDLDLKTAAHQTMIVELLDTMQDLTEVSLAHDSHNQITIREKEKNDSTQIPVII